MMPALLHVLLQRRPELALIVCVGNATRRAATENA